MGENFVLKHTGDIDSLRKQIAVSKALAQIGLASPAPIPTTAGADFLFEACLKEMEHIIV